MSKTARGEVAPGTSGPRTPQSGKKKECRRWSGAPSARWVHGAPARGEGSGAHGVLDGEVRDDVPEELVGKAG
jgi:hypothetical protein